MIKNFDCVQPQNEIGRFLRRSLDAIKENHSQGVTVQALEPEDVILHPSYQHTLKDQIRMDQDKTYQYHKTLQTSVVVL